MGESTNPVMLATTKAPYDEMSLPVAESTLIISLERPSPIQDKGSV